MKKQILLGILATIMGLIYLVSGPTQVFAADPTTQATCTSAGGTWSAAGFTPTGTPTSAHCDMTGVAPAATPTTEATCTSAGGTWTYAGVTLDGTRYGGTCSLHPATTDTSGGDGGAGVGGGTDTTTNISTRTSRNKEDCKTDNGNIDASNCGIIQILNTVLNFISGGIALAVIGNIIFAGIQYSTAQGDPSNASKAKQRIQNAVIAFIMYLCLAAFIEWLIPGGIFG